MSWVTVGVAGAGLLAGGLKANSDKKQYRRNQAAQAEMTRYSPWTGMQGKVLTPPSSFGTVMQGGLTGAMLGQSLGSGGFGSGGAAAGGSPPVAMNYQGSQWGNLA